MGEEIVNKNMKVILNCDDYFKLKEKCLSILKKEKIKIKYKNPKNKKILIEGWYNPKYKNKIYLNKKIYGNIQTNDENCNDYYLILLHEIGHYYDFVNNSNKNISTIDREKQADNYMMKIIENNCSNETIQKAKKLVEKHNKDY